MANIITKEEIDTYCERGSLEWFLRRNFGLVGQYYSQEFLAVIDKASSKNSTDEENEVYNEWYDAPDWEPSKNYSKEAWDAWQRALEMVDDLVAMGILDDNGIDSPYSEIIRGFCDNA